MLKKLLANKKVLIITLVVVIVFIGVVIAIITAPDKEESGESGIRIETEKENEKDTDQSDQVTSETDEISNGEGLEVKDTIDDTIKVIDGSGDWDDASNGDDKKDSGETEKQAENNQTDSKQPAAADDQKEDDGENLEVGVFTDDKEWTKPN